MKRRAAFVSLLLLLTVLQPLPIPTRSEPEGKPGTRAGATILSGNDRHLVIEWRAPAYRLKQVTIDGAPYDEASIPECPSANRPGEPGLPACSVLLGIPPGVQVHLTVQEVETKHIPGTFRLAPAPMQVLEPLPAAGDDVFPEISPPSWV
ncbi:MAG: C25 family peptidase propeptide domain-containing protein, partial [Chloroflexia bacterium]